VQPIVVESCMVGQFVEHCFAHLVGERLRVWKVRLERQAKKRDLVWYRSPVRAPFDRRHSLVQTVHVFVAGLGLVVDHDRDVLEQPHNLRRQTVQRRFDEALEAIVRSRRPGSTQLDAAERSASGLRAAASKRHVPMLLSVAHEPDSLVVTTSDHVRVHFLDWDRDPAGANADRPLLLVHGLSATAWIWAPIARRLRERTHVVTLDLRGHGLSDSPRFGYDLESLAYDALTVAVANGWGRDAGGPPFVVAGHGLGAMVAAHMGRIQPDSIAGVALIDGGWEDVSEATGMTAIEYERSIGDPPEVLASMSRYLADRRDFDPQTWDADQERAARAAVDEKHAGHVTSVVRPFALRASIDAMFSYRPEDVLTQIRAPLLIALAESGTADDEVGRERVTALADAMRARAAAGAPTATIYRFGGAGHNLMRYRAVELAAALIGLLEEANHQRP
jgi:pimeloyl-ACP methyl ester carboxylesterase